MSREQYRARGKKVQKLGRDGLVEQDKATGQEERISQRRADISFGPDRFPEQGLVQRTQTQGKQRRQRYQPPPEPVQPAAGNALDVPESVPAMRQADDMPMTALPPKPDNRTINTRYQPPPKPVQPAAGDTLDVSEGVPAMRQADDVPVTAPPAKPGHRAANKRRQQKQNNRLNPDAHPMGKDGADTGRLKFELGHDPPPDTDSLGTLPEESKPAALRGVDDVPARERPLGGHTQPSAHRRAESGGHLRFEPERNPAPPAPNIRTNRTRQAAGAAASTPPEPPPHGGTSTPEPASAPAVKLPHRQQKRYETAERRVEQAGRRLEKAQAKLPAHRRARLEQEYDANTGKVRHRLRFEAEVKPEAATPNLPTQAGRTVATAAVMKLHSKLQEAERDNTAVEAAHKGESATEQGAGQILRWGRGRLRSRPYRAVRQAGRRLTEAQTKLAWQTALRDNPKLRYKSVLAKLAQKQKLKRKYAQAAREAKKNVQRTRKAAAAAENIARAVAQFASAHKAGFLIAALLVLVLILFVVGMASCTATLTSVQTAYISTFYLADEEDICDSDLYYTELETDLQLDISGTETGFPGYDEYRYHIGEISHNPYELMAYLSAAYNAFTFTQVRMELERLFGEQYTLTREVITETRYEDHQPYEWRILQTTLTVKPLADVIAASLTPGEQSSRYSLYVQTYGNRQVFGNPFDISWLGYVSSGYGYRVHPVTGGKDLHRGIDIAVAQGTPIMAVQDGRVISAGNAGDYGLCIVIENDKGYQSRYAHCSSLLVSAGQEVKRGDVIAAVGSTGRSTGPHLHLEILLNGEYLNPYYFVDNGDDGSGSLPGTPGGPVIPDYPGEPMGDGTYAAMLAESEKYLGYPYVWGGSSPSTSFDCSGFVSWVLNQSGAASVGRLGAQALYNYCTPVSRADAQPGDLIFFTQTYSAPNPVSHVGIYVGNGYMIHCGDPISYANINSSYWTEHFYGFGRIP